jgi:hypothetical protein
MEWLNPTALAAESCPTTLGFVTTQLQPDIIAGILQSPHSSLPDIRRPSIWSDNTVCLACSPSFAFKTPSVKRRLIGPKQSEGQYLQEATFLLCWQWRRVVHRLDLRLLLLFLSLILI